MRKAKRLLATLMALAMLVTMIPVMPTAAEAAVSDYVLPESNRQMRPDGITLNLFDYWLTTQDAQDNVEFKDDPTLATSGINANHALKFGKGMSGSNDINNWTGDSRPETGLVEKKLSDGYPRLTTAKGGDGSSLSYLFNGQQDPAVGGKAAYMNVGGLLQQDNEGYYTYDSQKNFAEFDKGSKKFTLYSGSGVKAGGSDNQMNGQFFPFNTGAQVLNDDGTQKDIKSTDPSLNHYFGMHMKTRFQQPDGGMSPSKDGTPVTYSFSGDDDVWIFIDDVLVADLGGIHDATSVEIDFSTGSIVVYGDTNHNGVYDQGDEEHQTTNLKAAFDAASEGGNAADWRGNTFADETYHTLDFFYLERGNTDSNMRLTFNLVTTPESTLQKVDQENNAVLDAVFDLYESNENYEVAQNATPYATGTTDGDGMFTFLTSDDEVMAVSSLKSEHYVLRERANSEPLKNGYRSNGDIHLKLQKNENNNSQILLVDNAWDTGSYAMPTVRVSASTTGEGENRSVKDVNNVDHKINEGVTFAAVFKGTNVEYGTDVDDYNIVYGDPENGWHIGKDKGTVGIVEAAQAMETEGEAGLYTFHIDSANRFTTDVENLPDDINKYYWMDNNGAEYTGAYFYAAGVDSVENITADTKIYMLSNEDFIRDFAMKLYTPNINNKLIVQKTDANGTEKLSGATFKLYEQEDYDQNGETAEVVKDCTTSDDEIKVGNQTIKGAGAMLNIPLGEYYLVETDAPAGYTKSDAKIPVIVDDAGVHVNAGTANDSVNVTLGVGRLVKSMVQFTVDDGIDATLHDIDAQLQTTDDYPENANWSNVPGEAMALSYGAESASLEYGPTVVDGKTGLTYDAGWGRLNITQDYETVTENNSPKQDLNNQSLNNLFSGTVLVAVGNEKQAPGNIQITKEVDSSVESDKTDDFTVQLTIMDKAGLSDTTIYRLGEGDSKEKVEFTNDVAKLTIKHNETIRLEVPNGVKLKVEEVDQPSAFGVTYQVGDQNASETAPEIEALNTGAQNVTITNTRTPDVGDKVTLDGATHLSITKVVKDGEWPEGASFEFTIAGENGAPMPKDADGNEQKSITISKPTNDNPATASFGDITFTDIGEYTYTITETKGNADNMTYDDHKLTVTVKVTKDENGNLVIKDGDITTVGDTTFTNTIGKDEPDNPGGGGGWIPGGGGNEDTPDLNTEDHFSYIVGYPEDYRTGEKTDDESLWPVKPQGNITRAEVATIFYRLLTDEARTEHWTRSNDYSDVAAESWYNTPVSTLSAMGIVNGYEDGSFRPNAPITRAEFAAIAVRFFENDNVNYEEGLFTDIEGSEWFADAVAAAKEHGIIGGYPDGSFQPNKAITRAEACSIVNRTVDRIPDKDHLLPEDEMRVWPDNSNTNAWYYADMQEATSGHEYTWVNDDNDEPLYEQWTGDLPEVDWEQVEIDQEEKHGLR